MWTMGCWSVSVFRSSRKVHVSGSSLALTLPATYARANEIEKGAVLQVLYGFDGVLVISNNGDEEIVDALRSMLDKLEKKAGEIKVVEGI